MGRAIFVSGTDTGVGKTFFTCGLARWLKSDGYSVGVMKPVETGCITRDGALYQEDAWRLKEASGCAETIERICPYRLPDPLAPSIAAERAGVRMDIDRMLAVLEEIKGAHEITLIEGAGGLMVPLVAGWDEYRLPRAGEARVLVAGALARRNRRPGQPALVTRATVSLDVTITVSVLGPSCLVLGWYVVLRAWRRLLTKPHPR